MPNSGIRPSLALVPNPTGVPTEHPARAWARQQGIPIAASGRLSPDLVDDWQRAGSPVVALPAGSVAGRWALLLDNWTTAARAAGRRDTTIKLRRAHLTQFARTGVDPAHVDRETLTR
jgi:hypothetical protein